MKQVKIVILVTKLKAPSCQMSFHAKNYGVVRDCSVWSKHNCALMSEYNFFTWTCFDHSIQMEYRMQKITVNKKHVLLDVELTEVEYAFYQFGIRMGLVFAWESQ